MKTRFLSRFTPSLMSPEALEAIFVQREPIIRELLERIRTSVCSPLKQQTLLTGPRGIGKTHLISLIYYRVQAMKDINGLMLIAWLREEEWGISCLRDFLIRILRALSEQVPNDGLLKKRIEALSLLAPEQSEPAAAEILKELVRGRTLLLLVENVDELFERLGKSDQTRLRSFFENYPFFSTVATSPTAFDDVLNPMAPFGGFFQIQRLEELTLEDATQLMLKIALYEGKTDLASFVATPQGRARLRALRHLAGGNHRAFVIFSQLLARESLDELIEPLMRTIDDLTPYYHARIAALTPEQRKIIEYVCDCYHPVRAADISRDCYLTPENTSAQLENLNRIGHLQSLSIKQDRYYELREPLMRLSIEVKKHRGKPIRLLLDFLRLWYSPAELKQRLAILPPDAVLEREYAQPALQVSVKDWKDPRVSECCREYLDALREDDYARAMQAAEELVAMRGQVQDIAAQASCLTNLGRYDEAASLYDKLVALAPHHALIWQQRAWTLFRVGRFEEALASSDKSLELDPEKGLTWCCRASILNGLGRFNDALASCDNAIKLNDKDTLAWTTRGLALAELRCYEEAATAFARVVELAPEDPQGHHYLCAAFIELKRYDEALATAKKDIELRSEHPVSWILQGLALAGLNRHAEALAAINKAVDLGEDSSLVHFKRAELLLALGRWREGVSCLDVALARFSHAENPDSGNTAALIRNLFPSVHDPKILLLCIKTLVLLYRKHRSLSALGHGLIECIPDVACSAVFGNAASRFWRDAWMGSAAELSEFRLPLRFLEFAVRYRESQDLHLFMELPLEERAILESMIGVRVQVTA